MAEIALPETKNDDGFKFSCQSCGQHISADLGQVGLKSECPSCGAEIVVSPDESTTAQETSEPGQSGQGSTAGNSPSRIARHLGNLEAKKHAKIVLSDLQAMDFKEEILPLTSLNMSLVFRDFIFWSVATMGVVPLLLVSLNSTGIQLTGFCLFFALLWGVIFKKFILEDNGSWKLPLLSLFFTGVIGIPLLLAVYDFLPKAYLDLPQSRSLPAMLFGSVFQTGLCEELLKMVPVAAYLLWKRKSAEPMKIILVGLFSGLGFAAFENMSYADRSIMMSAELAMNFGAKGFVEGVQGAMVNVMLRSMSLVFAHALFSGIFSYFIALGFVTRTRRCALFLVGLLVASTVHGSYNASGVIQSTVPALLVIGAFLLFYGYVTKLRLIIASTADSQTNEQGATEVTEESSK
ncbi:MAG: PrsW family glutamic-type intramembrane protease [Roseibacillus sp.]